MPVTVQAFRGATVLTPTRVTTRPNFAKVAMRTSRPANLQSEFLSPVAALKGLCMSFSRECGLWAGRLLAAAAGQHPHAAARLMPATQAAPLLLPCRTGAGARQAGFPQHWHAAHRGALAAWAFTACQPVASADEWC